MADQLFSLSFPERLSPAAMIVVRKAGVSLVRNQCLPMSDKLHYALPIFTITEISSHHVPPSPHVNPCYMSVH